MFHRHPSESRSPRGALQDLIIVSSVAALVAATAAVSAAPPGERGPKHERPTAGVHTDQGPEQRIIVKFRDVSRDDVRGRRDRADRAIARMASERGIRMSFGRNLSVGAELMRVERGHSMRDAIQALRDDPDVAYVEEDKLLQPLYTPNDSRYNEQWHYFEATGGLNLPAAWDNVTGSGVNVAVLDTGYRPHADLNANIVGGYDMISDTFVSRDGDERDSDASDPGDWASAGECYQGSPATGSSWHGTHVAGTIAAVTGNGSGVAGVAYGAKVVPVRVLGRCGGYTSDIADGIIWAAGGSVSGVPANANPAQVINMSLGGGGSCSSTSQAAIDQARSLGATVVVAAGNENQNASDSNPANCNGVVTVAATNRNGGRAYYSNYGSVVDVAAPGGELTQSTSVNGILSTLNSGSQSPGSDSIEFYQGTSMATPHVAGVAALLYEADASITPDQVESVLKSSSRSFPSSCSQCGSGIVDAEAAVAAVAGGGGGGGSGDGQLENGVAETGLSGSTGTELRYTLEVPAGATDLSFSISGGSGDADLYVRFGAEPTTGSYDCRPWLNGNNETCDITNVQTGTYHVMVYGYSSFSGVDLVGSFTEDTGGGGGGTAGCPTGYTEYTGTLSGAGDEDYQPDGTYYYAGSGTHNGILSGATGTDFDLYLDKWQNRWRQKASSTSASSEESISYSSSSGYFVWRVKSYSGAGDYTLCLNTP